MSFNNWRNERKWKLNFTSVIVLAFLAQNIYLFMKYSAIERNIEASNLSIISRMSALEVSVVQREIADPLEPAECQHPEGSGKSKELPCWIEFYRLLESPQQFQGRWIGIQGIYRSGFEESGLLPNQDRKMIFAERGLWIEPSLASQLKNGAESSIIGKFKRGPAGHLGRYFGELSESTVR